MYYIRQRYPLRLLPGISAWRGFGRLVGTWGAGGSLGVTAGVLSGAVAAGVGGGGVRLRVQCLLGARDGRLSLIGKVIFQVRFVLYLILSRRSSLYLHPK